MKKLPPTYFEKKCELLFKQAKKAGFGFLNGSDIVFLQGLYDYYETIGLEEHTIGELGISPDSTTLDYTAIFNRINFDMLNDSRREGLLQLQWIGCLNRYRMWFLNGAEMEPRHHKDFMQKVLRTWLLQLKDMKGLEKVSALAMGNEYTALSDWKRSRQVYDLTAVAKQLSEVSCPRFEFEPVQLPTTSILKINQYGVDEVLLSFSRQDYDLDNLSDGKEGEKSTHNTHPLVWDGDYTTPDKCNHCSVVILGLRKATFSFPLTLLRSGDVAVDLPYFFEQQLCESPWANGEYVHFVAADADSTIRELDATEQKETKELWLPIMRKIFLLVGNFIRGMMNETVVERKSYKSTRKARRGKTGLTVKTSIIRFDTAKIERIRVERVRKEAEDQARRELQYQYTVAPLMSARWVKEENLLEHELPSDIKENSSGTTLFKVLRPVKGWTACRHLPQRPEQEEDVKLTKVLPST